MTSNKDPKRDFVYYAGQTTGAGCRIEIERDKGTDCDGEEKWDFSRFPAAMTYVPMQPWEHPYDLATGLCAGTIFPSLDLPFYGGGMK